MSGSCRAHTLELLGVEAHVLHTLCRGRGHFQGNFMKLVIMWQGFCTMNIKKKITLRTDRSPSWSIQAVDERGKRLKIPTESPPEGDDGGALGAAGFVPLQRKLSSDVVFTVADVAGRSEASLTPQTQQARSSSWQPTGRS